MALLLEESNTALPGCRRYCLPSSEILGNYEIRGITDRTRLLCHTK